MSPVIGLARLPGRILWCVHMGNFSPVDQDETYTIRDCQNFVDPCNFINKAISRTPEVEIHSRTKLYHFGRHLVKAKLFCRKSFVPVTGLKCSYGRIFSET